MLNQFQSLLKQLKKGCFKDINEIIKIDHTKFNDSTSNNGCTCHIGAEDGGITAYNKPIINYSGNSPNGKKFSCYLTISGTKEFSNILEQYFNSKGMLVDKFRSYPD